jgi:Ca2+-binding RTX toxin-like protein
MRGGNGDDVVAGFNGDDDISGGNGDDFAVGGPQNDVVSGDDGNDAVFGAFGDDTVSGGNGDDLVDGDLPNPPLVDPFPNFDSCNGNNGTDVAQNCEATTNAPSSTGFQGAGASARAPPDPSNEG